MSASASASNPAPALSAPLPTAQTSTSTSTNPAAPPPTSTSNDVAPQSHPLAKENTRSSSEQDGIGASTPPVPKVHLRVLVISGQSHMFSFEPEITVGRMKELIWSMWPSDWTAPTQPPSPAYLRVLHAGRILQDDSTLGSNNLPASLVATNPTVIHISVRSFSISPDEDPKKSSLHPTKSRTRGAEDDVGGCKCVIM